MAPSRGDDAARMPSLVRLKSLDSVENFDDQVAEARLLCTHNARTEMVLKWLLSKLSKGSSLSENPRFWKALAFTLRMLPRERAAGILRPSTLLEAAQQALAASQDDHDLLLEAALCLRLLIDLRAGDSGVLLGPMLTMPASLAAEFVAACHRSAAHLRTRGDDNPRAREVISMLMAISDGVWKARRHAPDEDEMFAQRCLVPTMLLLNSARSDGNSARKRDHHGDAIQEPISSDHQAKIFLCKHLFLPARKALLASQLPAARSKNQAEKNQPSISERLSSVKIALHAKKFDAELLPATLSVGLSFPAPSNPRQRSQERTWTEALFDALLDCLVLDGNLTHPHVLIEMLRVTCQRSSLSKEGLHKLVLAYGLPSTGTANLDIVAEIIALDATVLARKDRAETLFNAVSAAAPALGEHHGSTWTSLCERITVPTMRAFARNRDIKTFVELWKGQLSSAKDHCSIWQEITSPFAELVEEHLASDDLLALLRDYQQASSSLRSPEIVVTCAILQGIRKVDTLDALHEDIGLLVKTFFDESESTLAAAEALRTPHLWTLLAHALRLWLPLWLKRCSSRAELSDTARVMILAPIVKEAERILKREQNQGEYPDLLQAVSSFLTTLVLFLRPLCDETEQLCRKVLAQAKTDGQKLCIATALVNLPASALVATEQSLSRLVSSLGRDGRKGGSHWNKTLALALAALLETSSGSGMLKGVHSASTVPAASPQNDAITSCEQIMYTLQLIPELPLMALSASERTHLVDDLVDMPVKTAEAGETLLLRLAALTALLGAPCPAANVVSDPEMLLKLFEEAALLLEDGSSDFWERALTLSQELAARVCKQVLANAKMPGHREDLDGLATMINDTVKSLRKHKGKNADRFTPVAVGAMVGTLNESLPTEKRRALLSTMTINDLAEVLVNRIDDGADGAKVFQQQANFPISVMAGCLLSLPLEDLDAKSTKSLKHWASKISGASLDLPTKESSQALLTSAIALRRKLQDGTDVDPNQLVHDTLLVLQNRPPAADYEYLIALFGRACEAADSASRRTLLQALLPKDNDLPTVPGMALLKVLLPSVKKEDFATELEQHPDIAPWATLRYLLDRLGTSSSPVICHSICECLFVLLRTKSFMANQSTIEITVSTLKDMLMRFSVGIASRLIFRDTCRIFSALLQQHRARLRDRWHLVVELTQTLVGAFFVKPSAKIASKTLTGQHAQVLARLLQLLCDPPRLHGKHSDLVDEARKAQAHVGRYVQHVLHHYCSQVLIATPREGVREALIPGLWAMIEAMEVSDPDAVKILSSAMNNSERAVLRGVYEEYRMFGKWKGG